MKKIALVILLTLAFIETQAQSAYIPFPSNMVIFGRTETTYAASGTTYTSYRSEITGDTLIGLYHYEKLYSGFGPFTVTGGIRNDTVNKKVYMYSVYTGTEKLLYDFNLAVGDTVNRYNGYGFYTPLVSGAVSGVTGTNIDTAWVTSIDSVLMLHDGLYHRRFNFSGKVKDAVSGSPDIVISSSNVGPYNYSVGGMTFNISMEPLIEGVGQFYNPVNSYSGFEYQWNFILFCAYINNESLLIGSPSPDLPLCYSIFTGVDEIKKANEILVYPNPTYKSFQIKTQLELNYLEITNVLGEIIYRSEIKNKSTEVDLADKKPGIYFIRLTDVKGNYVVKKIVKE